MDSNTCLFLIIMVLTVTIFIYRVIKISIKHSENLERIKHGYPLSDGSTAGSAMKRTDEEVIDVRLQ